MGYENTSMDLKGFELTAVKCGDDCILIGKVFKHPQELHVCFPPCRPPSHIHFVITGQKHRDVINKINACCDIAFVLVTIFFILFVSVKERMIIAVLTLPLLLVVKIMIILLSCPLFVFSGDVVGVLC